MRLLLPVCLLAACGGSPSPADPDAGPDDPFDVSDAPARYHELAQTFADEVRASGVPGAALAIIEDGTLAYDVGVGRKDPEADERVDAATLFRIGSVTKMITATTVLQEVDAGHVDLDAPVTTVIPGFHLANDDATTITVRSLLDQTSALADYLEIDAPPTEQSDAALAAFLTGRYADLGYLTSPSGTFYNYANPNYMIAGLVAETSAATPYRTLVHDRVFAPLAMDRSTFLADDVLADGDYAIGATTASPADGIPARIEPDTYDNPWARPAGYAWSSVEDLARFLGFLIDGDPAVLSPSMHDTMLHPTHSTEDALDLERYGFGLVTTDGFFLGNDWYATPLVEHDGAIAGFTSFVAVLPAQRFGIVMLASGDDGAPFVRTLVDAISTLPALPAPSAAPDLSPDPSTFAEEAGTYVDPHVAGTITVSLVGGALHVDIPAATEAGVSYDPVLTPTTPRNFLLTIEGTPYPVTFIHRGPGEPTWLRTRPFVAVRAP